MTFTIYPAIDLRRGKVVRLKEGDPARMTAYSDDPAETARRWLSSGVTWLHVVNLDGAFGESDDANRAALRTILEVSREFNARLQFGGGLRSLDAMEFALNLGVSRVVLGTVAIENADIVSEALSRFGADRVAVGIDARDGIVRVRGWKEAGGIAATELAVQMRMLGVQTVIFTDVSRDGMGSGLNIPATVALAKASALADADALADAGALADADALAGVGALADASALAGGLDVIASGGVHTLPDVVAAREAGLSGVIIGRALYEGTIDLKAVLESNVS